MLQNSLYSRIQAVGTLPASGSPGRSYEMTTTRGWLEIRSREGLKVLSYEEHPRGDGSLRIVTIPEPLNARDLRAAAEILETREKKLAHDRAAVKE